MLTGKDVYEATLFEESDVAGKWDKLNTFDKHVHEVAASVLNGYHIAPLQAQIDGLEQQVEKLKGDIKELRDMDRKIFADQDREIAALKEMVQDLVDGLQDCWDNEYSLDKLNDLKARAQALLQGEES